MQLVRDLWAEDPMGGRWIGLGEIFVVLMQTTAVNMVIKVKDDIREKEKVKSKLKCLIVQLK